MRKSDTISRFFGEKNQNFIAERRQQHVSMQLLIDYHSKITKKAKKDVKKMKGYEKWVKKFLLNQHRCIYRFVITSYSTLGKVVQIVFHKTLLKRCNDLVIWMCMCSTRMLCICTCAEWFFKNINGMNRRSRIFGQHRRFMSWFIWNPPRMIYGLSWIRTWAPINSHQAKKSTKIP